MLPTYAKVKMTRDGFSQLRLDYNLMGFDGLQHQSRQLHKKTKKGTRFEPPIHQVLTCRVIDKHRISNEHFLRVFFSYTEMITPN